MISAPQARADFEQSLKPLGEPAEFGADTGGRSGRYDGADVRDQSRRENYEPLDLLDAGRQSSAYLINLASGAVVEFFSVP